MSVTSAPRARMAEKAAWPGVSRKQTVRGWDEFGSDGGIETENAPMCWVIPPASPLATEALRRVSRRVVLP